MPRDTYICSGWACQDCTILLANGDAPAGLSEEQIAEWQTRINEKTAGCTLTLGMLAEEHSCLDDFGGKPAWQAGEECDCERDPFSWSPCDVCGGNLGGERHAVSFWEPAR
jgi:hypothetical protein